MWDNASSDIPELGHLTTAVHSNVLNSWVSRKTQSGQGSGHTHPPACCSLGNALLKMNPWPSQSTLCQPVFSQQWQILITGPHRSLHRCTAHSHHNCLNSASSCCHVWSPRTFVYILGKRSHHRHKTWDPSRDEKRRGNQLQRERWNRPTFPFGVTGHHRGLDLRPRLSSATY